MRRHGLLLAAACVLAFVRDTRAAAPLTAERVDALAAGKKVGLGEPAARGGARMRAGPCARRGPGLRLRCRTPECGISCCSAARARAHACVSRDSRLQPRCSARTAPPRAAVCCSTAADAPCALHPALGALQVLWKGHAWAAWERNTTAGEITIVLVAKVRHTPSALRIKRALLGAAVCA